MCLGILSSVGISSFYKNLKKCITYLYTFLYNETSTDTGNTMMTLFHAAILLIVFIVEEKNEYACENTNFFFIMNEKEMFSYIFLHDVFLFINLYKKRICKKQI